ncbi:MAG: dihydroneopterin aldolase [Firmicutes bacterium]|nr:dihydroneopterin aldolase [Bacillota bacterium]
MVFYGYHGVFEGERELGQKFEVDVELITDLAIPGQSDDLEQSINYVDVYTIVQEIVQERTYNLIEAVAESIAGEILSAYSVKYIIVRVRKPGVSMGGILDYVEVEIVRSNRE